MDAPEDLTSATYEFEGTTYTLAEFFERPSQIGFLVVKDGNVVYERYADGNDRASRWVSFSVSKSVTSLLIGAAIKDGFISSVDEPVTHYLPRLRGTPYENSTIRDVLQMSSGVQWNEDYADPNSPVENPDSTDRDSLFGGDGSDTIFGGIGSDTVNGQAGTDIIDVLGGGRSESGIDTIVKDQIDIIFRDPTDVLI